MTRSVWKGPFVEESLIKKAEKQKNESGKKPIKTWSRKSTIIPDFVGLSFLIYNGKKFIPLTVSEDMVGHKFGEFAPTRQFFGHTPADKKAKAEETKADDKVFFISLHILLFEKSRSLIAKSTFFPTIPFKIGFSFLVLDLIFLFTDLTKFVSFLSFLTIFISYPYHQF